MSRDDGIEDEAAESGLGALVAQLPSILWQRRWYLVVPAVLALTIATAAAFVIPTRYESSGILLVQSPSLPEDLIGGDAAYAIDRRIAGIRQQIINRPQLVALIESNELYLSDRASRPLSDLIAEMRDAITLTPEQANLGSGRRQEQTISVRLAFEYDDPVKAQAVAQQMMEKVIELNASSTTEQRTLTVQFLTEQQAGLQRQIAEAEANIAELNTRYGGVLSSSSTAFLGGSAMSYEMQIASLERENASLRSQRETLRSADTRDPTVVAAEAQLGAALAMYNENHPDVAIARRRVAEARRFARQNLENLPVEAIDRQIAFNDNQLAALRTRKANDEAQVATVLAERSRAPLIQQQAAQLQQRVEGLYRQSEAVSDRLLMARAGARADEEQMGERLLVIDPPVVPDSPSWPNRPLIIALGLAGGLGLGLLLAFAVELFLRPVRNPAAIAAVTGARPLAMIPVLSPRTNGRWRGGRRGSWWRWRSRRSQLVEAASGAHFDG